MKLEEFESDGLESYTLVIIIVHFPSFKKSTDILAYAGLGLTLQMHANQLLRKNMHYLHNFRFQLQCLRNGYLKFLLNQV